MPGSRKIQHFTICVGNRPEDVQKWIAERKRNYPRRKQEKPLDRLLDGYGSSSSEDEPEKADASGPVPAKEPIVQAPSRRSQQHRATANVHRAGVGPARPSLLERLLENDQRRERLLTLQMLEYILYDSPHRPESNGESNS